jgi:hypothetical protein
MNYQIQIQFNGRYKLDDSTELENPLVIGTSADDDLVENVFITVLFSSSTYYLSRQIGSFTYTVGWDNGDVINFINSYMNSIKI